MFAGRYFPQRYFAPRYFPGAGTGATRGTFTCEFYVLPQLDVIFYVLPQFTCTFRV